MKRALPLVLGSVLLICGLWFALIPAVISAWYIFSDSGLKGDGPSSFAIRLHRNLSTLYPDYARNRIASGAASELSRYQIGETEWPLFGSCFYLWATEALQSQWEKDPSRYTAEPRVYAREAIEAAKELVIDPGHAAWVREHWGDDYLWRENCFYRMLVMSALTSHAQLTGSKKHLDLLRQQADGVAEEIAASRYGWIDDYPNQCYPTDVVAAIAAIKRADELLGIDRGRFFEESLRGFIGLQAEPYGLPPFAGDDDTGQRFDQSRGCGNSYFLTFAPGVWTGRATEWYEAYETYFWHANWFAAGFREFPETRELFHYDIDAGPVVFGLGTAATAFGTGAARSNGRFDHARTLASQLIATSWPLADGTALLSRMLSSKFSTGHAPYLGEAAIVFQLSREPHAESAVVQDGFYIPVVVWLILSVYCLVAWLTIRPGYKMLKAALIRGEK